MNRIVVNNRIIVEGMKRYKGRNNDIITGYMHVDGARINLTFNVVEESVLIHEWYKLQRDTIDIISLFVKNCFIAEMVRQKFPEVTKLIDDYNKAIAMQFPKNFIDKIERRMTEGLNRIEEVGLMNEFKEFALIP